MTGARPARPAPDTRHYTPTMVDLEARIGIESLDVLLAKRAEYVEECAMLRAKYGAFGLADHVRKAQLAQIKSMVRGQMLAAKRKVSNDEIDDIAHASTQYMELITEMLNERAKWAKLEEKIDAITTTIMRGTALVRFAGQEARL